MNTDEHEDEHENVDVDEIAKGLTLSFEKAIEKINEKGEEYIFMSMEEPVVERKGNEIFIEWKAKKPN